VADQTDRSSSEPTPEDFEDFVAAAPKVDPKGLSGKHRKADENEDRTSSDA
jgi:hypothetical protein